MKKETKLEKTRQMLIREWKNLRENTGSTTQFEKETGITIPSTHKIIRITDKGQVEIKRPDGFIVFLDSSDADPINYVRLHASIKDVIMTVGIYRGLQIAQNYKRKYADNLGIDYMKFMDKILQAVSKIKLITGGNNKNGK